MLLINKNIVNLYYNFLFVIPLGIARIAFKIKKQFIRDFRENDFDAVFKQIRDLKIEGDYLEFGVYRGKSFELAYSTAQKHKLTSMNFWAFDSFDGLPEAEGGVFSKEEFKNTKDKFMKFIKIAGMKMSKVRIIEGYYKNSLKKLEISNIKAAIFHIDCDLYESTKEVLSFIEPLLSDSNIIIFDDWFSFDASGNENIYGQKKAFNEWSKRSQFQEIVSHTTKIFIRVKV